MVRSSSTVRVLGTARVVAVSVLAACSPDATAPTDGQATPVAVGEIAASVTATSGSLELASVTSAGTASTTSSTTCSLSADGRLMLFASTASNLVGGDTNGAQDLFLRNLPTGVTWRVTTGPGGTQLARGGSCGGSTMTPDARLVAFNSVDHGGTVYVKNTQTGALTQVSPDSGAVPQVTGFFGGALSDDGTKVVFITKPQQVYVGAYRWVNVIPARLMLRDLTTGALVTLPTDNGNVADGEVTAIQFAISPDGQRVAFSSSSSTLVAGDTNGRPDLFVRNLADGTTVLASSTSSGAPAIAGGIYWRPAFVSNTQLAFGTGSNSSLGDRGLYLKDIASGALRLLLRDSEGGSSAVLSGDARLAVFNRIYSGFNTRIVARDLATGVETLVSSSASGTPSNGSATGAVVSRTGSHVAFGSSASNLWTPRPPTGVFQIYVRSLGPSVASLP